MCAPFRCASPSASGNSKSMFAGSVSSPRCRAVNAVRMHSSASAGPTSERTSASESASTSANDVPNPLGKERLVRLVDGLEAEDELAVHRDADDARVACGELVRERVGAVADLEDERVHRFRNEALVERELRGRAAELLG